MTRLAAARACDASGAEGPAVAADHGDLGAHAAASAILVWPVKSTMMTPISGVVLCFAGGLFGAEPAQDAGGAGAQFAARRGQQAGLVP